MVIFMGGTFSRVRGCGFIDLFWNADQLTGNCWEFAFGGKGVVDPYYDDGIK